MVSEGKNQDFERLRQEIFDYVMKDNPVLATRMGVHQYDGRLPEGSRESQKRTIHRFEKWRTELTELDRGQLQERERDSLKVGRHFLELRLFELKELRLWEKNPNQPQAIGSSLLPLLKRDFAPLETRLKSAIERIEGIPKFLENGKEMVVDPVELWVKVGLESLDGLPRLLESVDRAAEETDLVEEDRSRL